MQQQKCHTPNTKKFLLIIAVLLSLQSYAQKKFTISGTVKDKTTGELLLGATIKFNELRGGTITNSYGFFSITIPEGVYGLTASFIGYASTERTINLSANQELFLELTAVSALQEVVILNKKKNENVTKALMGVEKMDIKMINQLPVLLGEKDILKSIQLLPGIKSAGEGNSGFYVRGGAADQNLILLDEAPVYNASHLLGFFSTFNSDAVKDLTLYKGGMPSQYGGRLSSVVDIKMKDGNKKDYVISGGLGAISSRINIEGPIVKDESSFIISGRRSYGDIFLHFLSDSALRNNKLYFYDLNLKANFKAGKRDRLYLSGYFGRDVLGFGQTFSTDWGNSTATLRWNHIISNKLFSNTSLIYSDYNYRINFKTGSDKLLISSKIRDLNLKQDFDYFISNNSKFKYGLNIIRHIVSPGSVRAGESSGINNIIPDNKQAWESAIYASHELALGNKINTVYGLRLTNFTAVGPGVFYTYDHEGNTIGTDSFSTGQKVASYWNIEPRFSISYQLSGNKSVKASYNRNVQNLHLISNSVTSSPTDLWLPSSNNVKPEVADQVSVGYFQNFKDNQYELSVESYYKDLKNQIDYRNGASLEANNNMESELLYGKGRAYGIELLLKKKSGRLNGWVGYTLSKTERKIDGINHGKYFNARQDRTHDLSVVGIYKLNDQWTLSGTFVYSTGNAVTFPAGKYYVNGQTVFLYTERNGYRMPAYHRLDLAATFEAKRNKNRKFQSSWTIGLYNVYGRENAYLIEFKDDPDDPSKTIAQQTSLFKYVPSLTWNFKF
jgi:hypothetical protein